MHHLHLSECSSTQEILKEKFLDLSKEILISTDLQNQGFGRKGSQWKHFDHALAFSFTLPLNDTLTLTPLEIGCLLADFFKPNLTLKWPNDLLNTKREKVGGILCQLVGKNLIVGIGLNLYTPSTTEFDYPVGGIFEKQPDFKEGFKESLPLEIYEFIKKNRMHSSDVQQKFRNYCAHTENQVSVIDGEKKSTGHFLGISDLGEAILQNEQGEQIKVLTGSLRF